MSNILVAVDKDNVKAQINKMNECLGQARSVRPESTFIAVYDARDNLYLAKGYYYALGGVGLLQDCRIVYEDIVRVEEKISNIIEEKRRKQLPEWKH